MVINKWNVQTNHEIVPRRHVSFVKPWTSNGGGSKQTLRAFDGSPRAWHRNAYKNRRYFYSSFFPSSPPFCLALPKNPRFMTMFCPAFSSKLTDLAIMGQGLLCQKLPTWRSMLHAGAPLQKISKATSWDCFSAIPHQKLRSNGIMIGFPWSAFEYVHIGSTRILMPTKKKPWVLHVLLNENVRMSQSWAVSRLFSKLGWLKKTMLALHGFLDCGLPKTKDGMSIAMDWLGAESGHKYLALCLYCLLSSLSFCGQKD